MSSENVSSLVPEIYYDLIARICSGTPLVLALFWFYGLYSTYLKGLDSALLILLISGLGYLAGHLLTTISSALNALIWRRWTIKKVCSLLDLSNPLPSESLTRGFLNIYKRIDLIAEHDKTGGAILKKMEAGAAMTDNLLSGYIVLLGVLIFSKTEKEIPLAWFLLLLPLLLSSMILRRALLVSRQDALLSNLGPDIRARVINARPSNQ